MKFEDLEVYNLSMNLSDKIWDLVITWDYFPKDTIGKQWVRAADSISANISEGFGRNNFKDQRSFYYYSRGSLCESKTWLDKANRRKLIDIETYEVLLAEFNVLGIKLNNFINSVTKLMNSQPNNKVNNAEGK
ncbi:MAG: four helix bundle protein [Paludibacter sp.]